MNTSPTVKVPTIFKESPNEIVEVPLLLSSRRMEELVAMSRRRGISVAQILRQLIDQAIAAEARTV